MMGIRQTSCIATLLCFEAGSKTRRSVGEQCARDTRETVPADADISHSFPTPIQSDIQNLSRHLGAEH